MNQDRPRTRIQRRNRKTILDAALAVFSAEGFHGATLDQIARQAGLSKPNVLYYFASKEAIYTELLTELLETWLDPLREMDPEGDPVDEIVAYVRRKLQMSRDYPRESRLFAGEILQGAPRIRTEITENLREIFDAEVAVIRDWAEAGRITCHDPRHLIFSIWATTQHYADFDTQVRALLAADAGQAFEDAEAFLVEFYTRALSPA